MMPRASISIDLDDKWTYMKTRGDERWRDFPTYLNIIAPRVLKFFERHSLRVTFFLVGQDAALPRNSALFQSISDAGHEIGNHSFHHEPWLHLYSREEIDTEIARAESAIEFATGRKPRGFRGPGYSTSDVVAEVLASRGYEYDASTLPTFLGPLARAYYLLTATLDVEEKKRRSRLFGRLSDGLLPLKPYVQQTSAGPLAAVPVTTMPLVRTPFHLSYLLWLQQRSRLAARAYLRLALRLCELTGTGPSFLLHPLDFAAPEDAPELAFFPGMSAPLSARLELADFAVSTIATSYSIGTVCEHASQTAQPPHVPERLRQAS